MKPLEPPETHYLSAAIGWAELGNLAEARAELAQLGEALQKHPEVLEVRWLICAEAEAWEEGLEVARTQLEQAPEQASGWLHQAYALRRAPGGGLQQAWEALLPAADKFPEESIIPYNLACYACQLEQLEAARLWLKRARAVGDKEQIKRLALTDGDLQRLWPEIEGW